MENVSRAILKDRDSSSKWFSDLMHAEELIQESAEWAPSEYLESKKNEESKAFSDRIDIELKKLSERVSLAKAKLFGIKIDDKKDSKPINVKVKSRKMLNSFAVKTKKDIRRLRRESADPSALDSLMKYYRENRKKIAEGAVILVATTPVASALLDKVKESFISSTASIIDDTQDFMRDLKSDNTASSKSLKAAAAYASSYQEVSRDHLSDVIDECSECIKNVQANLAEGRTP